MTDSNRTILGWGFVLAQLVLFVVLVWLPGADHWPNGGLARVAGYGLMLLGAVIAVMAGLRLGPSLTPTPVPTDGGRLITTGLYRYSRHPIYSGVLLIVAGLVLRSGNVVTLAVGVIAVIFFSLKARWEEDRLRERYPDYDAYAATVSRFWPRLPN